MIGLYDHLLIEQLHLLYQEVSKLIFGKLLLEMVVLRM
jgi:hypothetical protein